MFEKDFGLWNLHPQASDKQKEKETLKIANFHVLTDIHAYVLKLKEPGFLYFHVFAFHLSLQHHFIIQVDSCCPTTNREGNTQALSLPERCK